MPAIVQDKCWDFTPLYREYDSLPPDEKLFHFEHCDGGSVYEGFWRWFFVSIRCECPCHSLHLTEQQASAIRKKTYRQAVALMLSPVLLIILLILFF